MINKEEIFSQRYDNLNEQQKEAVDTIYGPVMVIAGPGTGKTEILSMRIANLLRSEAQINPQEILCLTYTDEATVAMRKRLLEIIGNDAHRVNIHTFHAFCNSIIQANPEYFGMRELQPISELERIELLHSILEQLPVDHLLRRLKGDIYYDAKNLHSLFELMKSENWSPDNIRTAIDEYIADLPNREAYQYKRGNSKQNIKPGDPKQKEIDREKERMERTRSAAGLYSIYQQRMQEAARYDFSDMILWVIEAFRENEALLSTYQLRFQFVLVDEFQDTSLSQNEVLSLLMNYDDSPNLFVVGDDDQSIFAFQGARVKNIEDFYEKYQDTIRVVVLKENYRSSQPILDRATSLIGYNRERLINSEKLQHLGLDKSIISAGKRFVNGEESPLPAVKAHYNILNEEADIVRTIEELQQQGVLLKNIAVLYSQHRQADNIIALMERKGLPYWVKRSVNILDIPFIIQLINIFKYIHTEQTKPLSGEELLFHSMHAPFLGIAPVDIAQLSLYIQSKESKYKYWRFLLLDALLLETMPLNNAKPLHTLGGLLEKWITEGQDLTIPMLLEKVVYETGMVNKILTGENHVWNMQVLHTFFDFVKAETTRQPRLTLAGFLQIIDKMQTASISIPIQKVAKQDDGVRFYTAFGAKGHEFEYVFLVGATKNFWEKKSGQNRGFSLPDTLTRTNADEETGGAAEVMRRVFFVALTRAIKHLQVSFAVNDNEGKKKLEASAFLDEALAMEKELAQQPENISALDTALLLEYMGVSFLPEPQVKIELARRELLNNVLQHFALSASTLNKYINCPIAFYYEVILKVPVAKNDSLAFGIAVHYALEKLFKKMKTDNGSQFPNREEMLSSFNYKMQEQQASFTRLQYERRTELGEKILLEYYDHYVNTFHKKVEVEKWIGSIAIDGVPIKGKLDKIEIEQDGWVTVVDYKTGNPAYSKKNLLKPPVEEGDPGGDYWRQMVFYKILLDNSPEARIEKWKTKAGIFDYIEKDENNSFVRHHVPLDEKDVSLVKGQIIDTWQKIQNREFDTGCGKEDCHWCNFVKDNKLAVALHEMEDNEE